MLVVFLQTLPFFALVALGFGAVRTGIFGAGAAAALTRFVFFFALSALLFRFAAELSLARILDWSLVGAYGTASLAVYLVATAVALARGCRLGETAVEAQCAVIGNTGFLGIPLLVTLLGDRAAGPVLLVLSVDLLVFSSLIVVLVTLDRDRALTPRLLRQLAVGLVSNPMIVSIAAGLVWSAAGWPLPAPVLSFLTTLGAAATPGALFAIGASLAGRSAERLAVAGWLSLCKLVLHPAAVALTATLLFPVSAQSFPALVAAAALPVAGNVYMLAQHYGVAPQRASTAILVSTIVSVASLPAVIALVGGSAP